MTGSRTVGNVRLRTPAAWWDLDLDPATKASSIDQLLAQRSRGRADALRAALAAATEDAIQQRAVFASLYSDTVEGKTMSASLVVSVVDAVGDGDGESDGDPAGLTGIRLEIAEDLVAEFRTDGAAAEVRTLEAGPAARVRRRQPVETGPDPSSGRRAEVDTLQYFVPFPDGDRLAVMTFSTPNLGLADAFAELFDAIASTLQWST